MIFGCLELLEQWFHDMYLYDDAIITFFVALFERFVAIKR